ncbi:MAG TPA: metallophosphoesterase, partial [Mucilaginibacter sp.]
MKSIKTFIITCIFSLTLATLNCFSQSGKGASTNMKCLIVSDIHFSPIFGTTASDSLKQWLDKASFSEWISYFKRTPAQMQLNSNLYYQDSNYAELISAIANMKRRLPRPAFIVICGDFIWHNATPADSTLKKKTIQFIAGLFKQSFPGVKIAPTMGNNDTYGQDYALQ